MSPFNFRFSVSGNELGLSASGLAIALDALVFDIILLELRKEVLDALDRSFTESGKELPIRLHDKAGKPTTEIDNTSSSSANSLSGLNGIRRKTLKPGANLSKESFKHSVNLLFRNIVL